MLGFRLLQPLDDVLLLSFDALLEIGLGFLQPLFEPFEGPLLALLAGGLSAAQALAEAVGLRTIAVILCAGAVRIEEPAGETGRTVVAVIRIGIGFGLWSGNHEI